jgi:hypothetical protein
VTHPYHPLCGQTFELAAQNKEFGEDRVFYRDADGRMRYLPARWTSMAAPDPFVIAAAGRTSAIWATERKPFHHSIAVFWGIGREPAALGEQIDGWKVYWVGGWGRDRLLFYVMVARAEELNPKSRKPRSKTEA